CGSSGLWFVVYSGYDANGGVGLIYRSSTGGTGTVWNSPVTIESGISEGYSFAVASNGTSVYLAVISPTDLTHFWFDSGTVAGSVINWLPCSGANCVQSSPTSLKMFQIPLCLSSPGTPCNGQLISAGSPTIMVDKSSPPSGNCELAPLGACVWVTVPALDSSLNWHVEINMYETASPAPANWQLATLGTPQDVQLHAVYSATQSSVHAQMLMMKDGIAALFSVGNTPQLPHITILDHGDNFKGTFSPSGWNEHFYEQQSQAIVQPGTDTLFFAGLAQVNAVAGATVWYFTFTYNPIGTIGTYTAPLQITQVQSITPGQVKDHSWHIAFTYASSSGNLYLAYGVDNQLFSLVGAISGTSVNWLPSGTAVSGVSGLVDGVTEAAGDGVVGVVWVQALGSVYAVDFAIV
ncbi:MAG TPA: hypothetical protein VLY21_02345, partial [Nitrososphaerales archaeon]|nr:hypothetical protein [Nitrososphaerales archaeon]